MRTAGDRLRDEGFARVEAGEEDRNPGWAKMALEEIRGWALEKEYFTSDDVRTLMLEPHKPQAWGPVYTKAKRLGWIENAPEKGKIKSKIDSQHSHQIDWYHSLIYKPRKTAAHRG